MSRVDSDAFVHIPMQVRRDMYRNRPFSIRMCIDMPENRDFLCMKGVGRHD